MDLDWITLYDYMSIFSRSEITSKINKFYESFYPMKLKKTQKRLYEIKIKRIQRGGLFGIIASYISKVLLALQIYCQTQYLLTEGDFKQQIKLCKMFVQIQTKNLQASLNLQKLVYVINEAYKYYIGKQEQNQYQKDFLQIKLLCSLNRMLQFYYHFQKIKKKLQPQGYQKVYNIILNYSIQVLQMAKPHLKLFPQIRQILQCILRFFQSDQKQPFNFHAHLMQQNSSSQKKTFTLQVKKLFSLMPNKQKNLFLNLSDQHFFDFLVKSGCQIQKQPIQNYFRSQQQINSLIAQQQNFVESILVLEKYRGKPEWKKIVVAQLMNLSIQTKKTQKSKLLQSQKFKLSNDFPINLT